MVFKKMSKRILVIGGPGSGKSTFAERLGKKTSIKVFHLDEYYWKPGWQRPDLSEWKNTIDTLCKESEGIIDGVYSKSLEQRLIWAETIYYLDVPLRVRVWRVVKRTAGVFLGIYPPKAMALGCKERLDLWFLKWVINFDRKFKPELLRLFDKYKNLKEIIYIRN